MLFRVDNTNYNIDETSPITVDEGEILADASKVADARPMLRKLVEGRIGKKVGSIPFDHYMALCMELARVYRKLMGMKIQKEFNDAFAKFDATKFEGK